MESRSILVVEDEPLLRELIATALESRGFLIQTAATAADAKRAFQRVDPDGVVIDVNLGPGPNGFDLAEALIRFRPEIAIVFLTNLPDPRFADRSPDGVPTGVWYLRKSAVTDIDSLVSALDSALRGAAESIRHDRDDQRPLGNLTRKQLEVLRLVAEGRSNAQIAQVRGTTVKAVEDTIHRICMALGIDSAEQANTRVAITRRFLIATAGGAIDQDGP